MVYCRSRLILLLITILGVPVLSMAQPVNTTCDKPDFLFLNERARYQLDGSGSLFFSLPVSYGKSYAIQVWIPEIPQAVGVGTRTDVRLNIYHGSTNPGCTTASDVLSLVAGSGFFTPTLSAGRHDGYQAFLIAGHNPITIEVKNNRAIAYPIHILAAETTLFSPWWFTGGTNQAFVEIGNTTNIQMEPILTLRGRDGLECGSTSVFVAGFGNAAVNVAGVGTCASALSGSAQIAFPGSPGGLVANITTLDVVNGTSFDAPFSPRMVWGTFSR